MIAKRTFKMAPQNCRRMFTRSKVSVSDTLFLVIIVVALDTVLSSSVCNTMEHGQFTCECMEISNGYISVDCSNNNFKRIPADGFPRETNTLDLKNNKINQLRTNDFLSAPHLRHLTLNHNEIETIQPNSFRGLTSLVNLTLSHNYLTRIEATMLSDLVSLIFIDLKQNDLHSISSDAFFFMSQLRTVDLEGVRLQCDCETLHLRTWFRNTGKSLAGAKCSNFIKNRNLEDVPDDQFGDCTAPAPQSCSLCTDAGSVSECIQRSSIQCDNMDSCQVTIDVTSGQQAVNARCQEASACIGGVKNNSVTCGNGRSDQHCTLCCAGPECNRDVNDHIQGYTYESSMVISFSLTQMFDDILLDPDSARARQLSANILHTVYTALASMGDVDLHLKHFRPSFTNQTIVTIYAVSVWDMNRGASHIRDTISGILDRALAEQTLKLDVVEGSLIIYTLGYCAGEITLLEEGEFNWPNTACGSDVTIDCPYPDRANGRAQRSCISVWDEQEQMLVVVWDDPDLAVCATPSNVTDNLKKLLDIPITNDTVSSIIHDLRELTSGSHIATDLEYASVTLEGVLGADIKIDDETAYDVVAIYDNLLGFNMELLQKSQEGFNSMKRALLALDNFARVLLEAPDDVITLPRISVGVVPQTSISHVGASLFHTDTSDAEQFEPGQVTLFLNSTNADPIAAGSSIVLPASVLNNMRSQNMPVQFVVFSDDTFFKSISATSDGQLVSMTTNAQPFTSSNHKTSSINEVNSVIMAASLGGRHVENLEEPVVLTFAHKKAGSNARCAFWDFDAGYTSGGWSSRGCYVIDHVDNEHTVCGCNHLTNFALIMDIYGDGADISEGHKMALNMISYIGCGISLAALILTLLTYSIFTKLHKDNPSKLLMNLCVTLSFVMIFFILTTQPAVWKNTLACQATAGLLHYFVLSTWVWMAVEAFYMYLALIKIFKTYISRFILKSCLVGWGVPAVIVIITVAISTDHYGQQGDICWLAPIPFYWSCLAPIAVIMIVNFVVFGMVIHQLRKLNARNDKRAVKQFGIKTQLRGAVAVVILLGLTWVFAIFAVGRASVAFQYLFCIFNSLQGLFIFIFYCVMKKDVKDIWKKKWTEVTSTSSTSHRTYGKGERFLTSRTGSVPNSTLATDSPRITTLRRTTDHGSLSGSMEHLNSVTNDNHSNHIGESET